MAFDRATGYAASESGLDIYAELATAYVPPEATRNAFTIIDRQRAELLAAWASTLIPGNDAWPSGGDIGSVEYIDQNLARAPKLRPLVLQLIDHANGASHGKHGKSFPEISTEDRAELMSECEKALPTAFLLVMELVFEAYYRHPAVLKAVEARTGFRSRLAVDGFSVPQLDDRVLSLLADMSERPSLVREVEA